MIDYHCHILPGFDDGASSLDESLEMAHLLFDAGFSEVCCTPHCMKGAYENTPERVREGVFELQRELDCTGIFLKLHPGMEYYLDEFFPEHLDDLLPLGDTGLVLIEAPTGGYHEMIRNSIFQVNRRGYQPLFAHPERYQFLAEEKPGGLKSLFRKAKRVFGDGEEGDNSKLGPQNSKLLDLRAMGCKFQGNLGSFSGFYGRRAQTQAEALRDACLYHYYGTDAHSSKQIEAMPQEPMKAANFG